MSFMDDNRKYPDPTSTVLGGLGLANLDILRFAPTTCVYPHMDYYHTLIVKTVGPIAVVGLVWTWPLMHAIRGKPYGGAVQQAAKLSLTWLQLIYVSVSTTVLQCFV